MRPPQPETAVKMYQLIEKIEALALEANDLIETRSSRCSLCEEEVGYNDHDTECLGSVVEEFFTSAVKIKAYIQKNVPSIFEE